MSAAKQAKQPYQHFADRRWFIRLLEIFPGVVTWSFLIAPIILSIFQPLLVAYFIIAFDIYWLLKAFRLSYFLIRGYSRLRLSQQLDWSRRLDWLRRPGHYLKAAEKELRKLPPASFLALGGTRRGLALRHKELEAEIDILRDIQERRSAMLDPDDLFHLVIMATYNESRDILEPSVQALLDVAYPSDRIMLVMAYEERGPESTQQTARDLIDKYGHHFAYAAAVKHPDGIAGEVRGKGGNITFAGRQTAAELARRGIDPEHVIVTTFDSDHRAGKWYFANLAYTYATDPNRVHKSYQPVPMFYNNIWDAPAPMRVIAVNNSFWVLIETMRPHRLRNFAAHAQSLRALLDTDFWSVSTIVEDGHQYWRSFFAFDGDHEVVPLYAPVFQDAVLAENYRKTFVDQYKQMQRWAWGVSDFQFVVRNSIKNHRINTWTKLVQIFRLFEGHFSWATAALTIGYVAWLPLFLNEGFRQRSELAHQLPIIASYLQNMALLALIVTVATSMLSLPPRPPKYGRRRSFAMVLQWVLLPVVGIAFGSVCAIDSQTRLMLGRYLEFNVTAKSRKTGIAAATAAKP